MGFGSLGTQITALTFTDYMTLYNSFGLSGPRFPLWYPPTFLTSFNCSPTCATELDLSPTKQSCAHLRASALTVAPAGNALFQIFTWTAPFCHLGFSLNFTISEDFADHPMPFCFLLCTPSLPSAHFHPINMLYSLHSTHHYRKLLVYLCPPNWNINARTQSGLDLGQVPRTVAGTKWGTQ